MWKYSVHSLSRFSHRRTDWRKAKSNKKGGWLMATRTTQFSHELSHTKTQSLSAKGPSLQVIFTSTFITLFANPSSHGLSQWHTVRITSGDYHGQRSSSLWGGYSPVQILGQRVNHKIWCPIGTLHARNNRLQIKIVFLISAIQPKLNKIHTQEPCVRQKEVGQSFVLRHSIF